MEVWSAIVCLSVSALCTWTPSTLLIPPVAAKTTAIALGLLGGWRGLQACRIIRYHHNLKLAPRYELSASNVPYSRSRLFLGRGFRWTQKHTQRLRDTTRPEAKIYLEQGHVYRWMRCKEREWEHRPILRYFALLFAVDRPWNPFRPLPSTGGKNELHGVELRETDVWMNVSDRVGHTLVLGTTRVGKTRLAELLIAQDIRRGDVVIVFDPKGDTDLLRRTYAEAIAAGRREHFHLFHLGYPEISSRYNAIGRFSRITEVATRIANQLPNQGNSAAFREFAWRFVNIVARALVELRRVPDYHQIRRYINDIEPLFLEYAKYRLNSSGPEDWREQVAQRMHNMRDRSLPSALRGREPEALAILALVQKQNRYDPVMDGLISAYKYDRTYFDKIVSSVGPLMEKLTTGAIADLISPNLYNVDDKRPIFEWLDVIRKRGIVYVGLDSLAESTVAAAVGNSMFADLVSIAGHIYKHGADEASEAEKSKVAISLHADEFNEIIGDEFVPLLNKAGGAGFQVTAYTQTWSDVEARLGNRAKAGQVAGNFNTLLALRVKELATAEMFTNQLPLVEVKSLISASAATDSSVPNAPIDFESRNEDRINIREVPLLSATDLMVLPRGHAFALLDGGQPWKLRLPLIKPAADVELPVAWNTVMKGRVSSMGDAVECETSSNTGQ